MKIINHGCFKVYYSPGSHSIAEQLLTITNISYPVFKEYFKSDHDLCFNIYWADKNDWPFVPGNKYPHGYGMPHMVKGTNHTHGVILPAANIDMPDRLTNIIEPLLDITKLTGKESADMKNWLGLSPGTTDKALRAYMSTSSFYVDYLINIVHIHEVMHDFCLDLGISENYGRDGRQAWWVFEGLAQWSVLWVNREINNGKWADIHDLFYRWMYRTGKGHSGNIGPNGYSNYAWFHGALVEMFNQLEKNYGEGYGPEVMNQILGHIRSRGYITDKEIVEIFSEVAGEDLSRWFKNKWGI